MHLNTVEYGEEAALLAMFHDVGTHTFVETF